MDSSNRFGVGARGDKVIILESPMRPLTQDEALNLGTWLVVMSQKEDQFPQLMKEIHNS